MINKSFYTIGHVKVDLLPTPHLGGPGPYIALALAKLGVSSHLVTKADEEHDYIKDIKNGDVEVHILPNRDPAFEGKTTSGENVYDEVAQRRTQKILERQENIMREDTLPDISKDSIVMVAPDIGEVDEGLFSTLRDKIGNNGFLMVSPQGYFREVHDNGVVTRRRWQEHGMQALQHTDAVILSDEDLTFDGKMDEEYLNKIRDFTKITVLTKGPNGLTLFHETETPLGIRPFRLSEKELSDAKEHDKLSGAGDSCAAAFIWHYSQYKDVKEAGVFAALYPALKIMGIGGKEGGIGALPTLEQVRSFVNQNRESRVADFLKENKLEELRLSPEGNHTSPEVR